MTLKHKFLVLLKEMFCRSMIDVPKDYPEEYQQEREKLKREWKEKYPNLFPSEDPVETWEFGGLEFKVRG